MRTALFILLSVLMMGALAESAPGRTRAAEGRFEAERVSSGATAAGTALKGARRAAWAESAGRFARREAATRSESYRAGMIDRLDGVKRESERIAAELAEWELPRSRARAGARLLMPVAGGKSSDFGMRYDPYYHLWRLHEGMDISAGGGEPIYAAADGAVASAGWRGGNGNYTCLSHGSYAGQNLSTCYGHQSRILVNVGQRVRRGQLIGRVGTTGASTGNHLHFEVRLEGTPVDPGNWLPACLC